MICSNLSADMTLGELYDAHVYPNHREVMEADSKTVALDRIALEYWRKFTGDPPLWSIDEAVAVRFVNGLKTLPGRFGKPMARSTIVKHSIHVKLMLRFAVEADLPKKVPKMRTPRPQRVVRLEWSMFGDGNWLNVPPEIFKGGEHGGLFYVNSAAREVIDCLRSTGYERIFPFRNWPRSSSWLQEQRRRQWAQAGIDQPGCGFHALRRTALTWLAGKNELVARLVAGHTAGGDMLAGHYVDRRHVVPELLEQLPQPEGQRNDDIQAPQAPTEFGEQGQEESERQQAA